MGEDTRERLQQVALDLFWKKGFRATTTRDIAAGLGVQQASLYYHMTNKEELLYEICYSSLLQVIQGVEVAIAATKDPLEALRRAVCSHLTTTLAFQKQFFVSISDYRSLSEERTQHIKIFWGRYEALFSSIFDNAKKKGVVRKDIPNRYLYHLLMGMMNWSVLWFRPELEMSIGELEPIFTSIFVDGAATASAKKRFLKSGKDKTLSLSAAEASSIQISGNETFARLLDTASALFARKGYSSTSIREIAEEMGIEKASLYYYLKSKEDLSYQISKAAHEHLMKGVAASINPGSDSTSRLQQLVVSHIVYLLQHQNWQATANEQLNALSAPRRKEIVALRDKYEAHLRQILKDAQDEGILRTEFAPKYLGLALLGLITHIYPWFEPERDVPSSKLGEMAASLFLYGIASL